MSFILNINTATESAVISISEKDKVITFATNNDQKDHASFLQPAIKNLLQQSGLLINKLNAVAVTAGPGSYTGLRVGMASAKGLCYALNIPLITISTLKVIALSMINYVQDQSALYCPVIDARRMEIFTAVYNHNLVEILNPCSMILDDISFKDLLSINKIYFSGSGNLKIRRLVENKNAIFIENSISPDSMAQLAYESYININFSNVTYASPVYLKEFYTKNSGE